MKNKQISLSSHEQQANTSLLTHLKKSSSKLLHKLSQLFAHLFILLIKLFRPLLGPQGVCPFTVGCTEYAIMELKNNTLLAALFNTSKRLFICNPVYLYFKK